MPLFDFVCEKCECTVIDKICSHDKAKEFICPECGAVMKIKPVKGGGFKIFGFSMENGYTRDNISYDGNPNPSW